MSIDNKLTRLTRRLITWGVNAHVKAVDRAVEVAAKRATVAADEHEIARWESQKANERKRAAAQAEDKGWKDYADVVEAATNELQSLPRVGLNA